MSIITFTSKAGREFKLDLPDTGDAQHVFVLSAAKCGSSLLTLLLMDYLRAENIPFYNPFDRVFQQGVLFKDLPDEVYTEINARPGIYLGFRALYNLGKSPRFQTARKVALVRDPRDALVSHYFSVQKSHSLPADGPAREAMLKAREAAGGAEINNFIQNERVGDFIVKALRGISRLNPADTVFYRYEDVIFKKGPWLRHMLGQMGVADINVEFAQSVADKHDIVPDDEDPSRHVRQVTPGNFRRHLSEETIRQIESEYMDVFIRFGYTPECEPLANPDNLSAIPLARVD